MPAAKATGRDKPVPYDRCSPHVGAPAPAWKFRIAFRPVSRNRRPTASQAASYAVPTDAIGQLARRMVEVAVGVSHVGVVREDKIIYPITVDVDVQGPRSFETDDVRLAFRPCKGGTPHQEGKDSSAERLARPSHLSMWTGDSHGRRFGARTTTGCFAEPAPRRRPCARRPATSLGRCRPSPGNLPPAAGNAARHPGCRAPCTVDAPPGGRCR